MNHNWFRMTVPSVEASKAVVNEAIGAFLERIQAAKDDVERIKVCVSEVLDNCILHAYIDEVGPILVFCRILKDDVVNIVIQDKGQGIEDIEKARQPFFTTKSEGTSGLGFSVVEAYATSVRITSTPGKGTKVNMKIKTI